MVHEITWSGAGKSAARTEGEKGVSLMLKAFQTQLRILAEEQGDKFDDQVKSRYRGDLPDGLASDLKEFVKILPQIERRIYSLYVWLPADSAIKDIGSHFLTYMYQPDDFLPENEANGLFGYLDDAYLAALFYELMIEEIQVLKQYRLRKTDTEFLRKLVRLRKKTESIIADEAIQIKQMLGELFEGEQTTFNKLFEGKIPA